jgi:16S rRNA C1402 (ribose-2'-O) methylase RsmI
MAVVLMDAPYRMAALLDDVGRVYGGQQPVVLACDLTLPDERIYRGTLDEVRRQAGGRKSEFVLVIHASPGRSRR